jgi:hypothetical protein
MILQSFFLLSKYESNEMDGNVARARGWSCEKFQHNSVSKRLVRKSEGRVPFIPLEAKGRGLDHLQVSKQEREHTSLRRGAPLGFGEREKRNGDQ